MISSLSLYNMHTGEKLADANSDGEMTGFTPDGSKVWCATDKDKVDWWAIVKEDGQNSTVLEYLGEAEEPLGGFPWKPFHDCQVADDGWVINSSREWLLWLPHPWRSAYKENKRWSGKFLIMWNNELPEGVIVKLEV